MKTLVSLIGIIALLILTPRHATCQPKTNFAYASPTETLSFPKDHASHDDFRTEWWYYTGHLSASGGKEFGYELTFFRKIIDAKNSDGTPGFKKFYFAHFAITDAADGEFYYKERLGMGPFAMTSGARTDLFKTYVGDWSAQDSGKAQILSAATDTMQLSLVLEPAKSPALHGENGYYRKGEASTNASMYYSYTRLNTKGTIMLNGTRYEVSGQSWMDHEFGTDQLEKNMAGWDWFSLQFDDNTELMLYQLRKQDSTLNVHSGGTFVDASGKTENLTNKDFVIEVLDHYVSQKTGGTKYPSKWKIRVPKLGIEATVTPLVQDQELAVASSSPISYWEGLSAVKGVKNGKPVLGKGYVELTGYRKPIGNRF